MNLYKKELSILTCGLCKSSLISLMLDVDIVLEQETEKKYHYYYAVCDNCKLRNGFRMEATDLKKCLHLEPYMCNDKETEKIYDLLKDFVGGINVTVEGFKKLLSNHGLKISMKE